MTAKRLPPLVGGVEIVGELEQALQEPRLPVEPIVGEDWLGADPAADRRPARAVSPAGP